MHEVVSKPEIMDENHAWLQRVLKIRLTLRLNSTQHLIEKDQNFFCIKVSA